MGFQEILQHLGRDDCGLAPAYWAHKALGANWRWVLINAAVIADGSLVGCCARLSASGFWPYTRCELLAVTLLSSVVKPETLLSAALNLPNWQTKQPIWPEYFNQASYAEVAELADSPA